MLGLAMAIAVSCAHVSVCAPAHVSVCAPVAHEVAPIAHTAPIEHAVDHVAGPVAIAHPVVQLPSSSTHSPEPAVTDKATFDMAAFVTVIFVVVFILCFCALLVMTEVT